MFSLLQTLLSLHLKISKIPNNRHNDNKRQLTQNIVNATLYQYSKATNQTLQFSFPDNDSLMHESIIPDVILYIHVWPILLITMLGIGIILAWRSYNRTSRRSTQAITLQSNIVIEARYKIYNRQRTMSAASLLLWRPLIQQQPSIEELDDFNNETYTTALSSRGVPI